MKPKSAFKIGVDLAMTLLFIGQMGYHMMDNWMHEWAGIALCLLFILHHILNGGWHRRLFSGRYTAQRALLTAVDGLLTLAMAAVMVSAVWVSRSALDFLDLGKMATGRRLHMPATMWAFVLTGLHVGLHWNMAVSMARRAVKGRGKTLGVWAARLLTLGLAGYGLYEFVRRGLWMDLLMMREFAFFDYGESFAAFFVSYLAMLVAWTARRRSWTKRRARPSALLWKTWMNMKWSFWACPTGGIPAPWPSRALWSNMIFPARPWCPLWPMAPAAFPARSGI